MEPVPPTRLKRPRITPCLESRLFRLEQALANPRAGWTITAVLNDAQGEVSRATAVTGTDFAAVLQLPVPEDRLRLWQPGDGQLYDIDITLTDPSGAVVDRAGSYAGMRSVAIDGYKILINGVSVFQRLVLDQGYYPDGLLTAPSDESLMRDISKSMQAGFNGARLHQKVFEERFLYHADILGYLVWGEYGDWGFRDRSGRVPTTVVDGYRHQPGAALLAQWMEVLERDYSHPSIIGWCPLNETSQPIEDYMTTLDDVTRGLFLATKNADTTRPVLDTSGYSHRVAEADVYDSHGYTCDPAKFTAKTAPRTTSHMPTARANQPAVSRPAVFCQRIGGTGGIEGGANELSWDTARDPRILTVYAVQGLCDVLLDNEDVRLLLYVPDRCVPGKNGILTFDRRSKLNMAKLHAIQTKKAAIETM